MFLAITVALANKKSHFDIHARPVMREHHSTQLAHDMQTEKKVAGHTLLDSSITGTPLRNSPLDTQPPKHVGSEFSRFGRLC